MKRSFVAIGSGVFVLGLAAGLVRADPIGTSESPANTAVGSARAGARESVVSGTIAWSDREGIELTLGNGTHVTVPLSVKSVLHTDLKPRRPIKAYCEKVNGENVATLLFTEGVHPGGGG